MAKEDDVDGRAKDLGAGYSSSSDSANCSANCDDVDGKLERRDFNFMGE